MGLIYPNQAKTRHWNGALQARLTRVPLEEFLRTHSLKIAGGAARDCDNLARAAVCIIGGGLKIYFHGREEGLAESQHGVIGRMACLTTRALAGLILEPASWRIAALVSTAQLLSPWIGLHASACASASLIHQFTIGPQDFAVLEADTEMTEAVSAAIKQNDRNSILAVAEMIAKRLSMATETSRPEPWLLPTQAAARP